MKSRSIAVLAGLALSLSGMAAHAAGQGIDDPRRADYFKDFAGKTIAFVPVTMGIDLTEGWAVGHEETGRAAGNEVRGARPAIRAPTPARRPSPR